MNSEVASRIVVVRVSFLIIVSEKSKLGDRTLQIRHSALGVGQLGETHLDPESNRASTCQGHVVG